MSLIIFDIDGTLTDTNRADEEVFVLAMKDYFGEISLSTDWSSYQESTDSGIFVEVFEGCQGRPPKAEEIRVYKQGVQQRLQALIEEKPQKFTAVEGAQNILEELRGEGHAVAIATGAWDFSARQKLEAAGIAGFDKVPRATADDALKRRDIIATAIERAREHYTSEHHQKAFKSEASHHRIYIGDGLWDFRASQDLGIRFIGRCDRGRLSSRLEHAHIVQSFCDPRFRDWI